MNVVASSGDVLHHHHALTVSVGGTDEEGDMDPAVSPDEEGRARRRPTRGQSRIEFERLAAFFHVPINEAAKGLGVCATVLKKVCRKHGIPRWPHRKIKKLDTMLAMLETAANKPGNPQHDDDVRKKMEAVMRDRAVLMTEGKLVGEGKSEGRRSKADGKGRERKRKKPDDEEDDEDQEDGDTSHDANSSYSLSHSGGASEQELLQNSGQMIVAPMNHMNHISAMDMNGMNGYHVAMGGYANPNGYVYSNNAGMNMNGTMMQQPGNYSYNSLFWSAMNGANQMGMNNISLPGVHSISSGVISSTTGMMMHNLPPPLPHSNLSLTPTPISPLTPNLSSSNPLPILHPNPSKHQKLSHSDVLLTDHAPHFTPYQYHTPPASRGGHPTQLAYSDFSVQHDAPGEAPSHFRLFGVDVPVHPTTASE